MLNPVAPTPVASTDVSGDREALLTAIHDINDFWRGVKFNSQIIVNNTTGSTPKAFVTNCKRIKTGFFAGVMWFDLEKNSNREGGNRAHIVIVIYSVKKIAEWQGGHLCVIEPTNEQAWQMPSSKLPRMLNSVLAVTKSPGFNT